MFTIFITVALMLILYFHVIVMPSCWELFLILTALLLYWQLCLCVDSASCWQLYHHAILSCWQLWSHNDRCILILEAVPLCYSCAFTLMIILSCSQLCLHVDSWALIVLSCWLFLLIFTQLSHNANSCFLQYTLSSIF